MLGNDRGGFLLSDALRQGGISIGISNFNIFGQGVFLGVFLWAGGIWVGICGELGSDFELTERFVKAGIDELSVYPAAILPLKKRIRGL